MEAKVNVVLRLFAAERPQVVTHGNALPQLAQATLGELVPELGLADKNDLQKLSLVRLQIRKQAHLFQEIGTEILDFVTEKSKLKIGRYTPGGHIPVLPDSALTTHKPDYALLLAWNFSKEIMANLKDFRKRGGRFIIPVPKPKILR